jgi:hypothetical protein
VHAYLLAGVTALVEAWLVQQRWEEETRSLPENYYSESPS